MYIILNAGATLFLSLYGSQNGKIEKKKLARINCDRDLIKNRSSPYVLLVFSSFISVFFLSSIFYTLYWQRVFSESKIAKSKSQMVTKAYAI